MKQMLLKSALVLALGFSLISCRQTEKKTEEPSVIVIEKKEDHTSKKAEGALEKAGRAIDHAAKEVKDAGKAIDSAAKEISGEDN